LALRASFFWGPRFPDAPTTRWAISHP